MPGWLGSKTVIGLPDTSASRAYPDATKILVTRGSDGDGGHTTGGDGGTAGICNLRRHITGGWANKVPGMVSQRPLVLVSQRLIGIVGIDGLGIGDRGVGIRHIAGLLLRQISREGSGARSRVIVVILTITLIVRTQKM